MKWLSDLRASYRKTQRLLTEQALQQGKRRFVWIHGVLFWCGIGLVVALREELRGNGQPVPPGWNLLFILCALLLFGFFGYFRANWKWNDYEQMCK
jgi:hypothetical protein